MCRGHDMILFECPRNRHVDVEDITPHLMHGPSLTIPLLQHLLYRLPDLLK